MEAQRNHITVDNLELQRQLTNLEHFSRQTNTHLRQLLENPPIEVASVSFRKQIRVQARGVVPVQYVTNDGKITVSSVMNRVRSVHSVSSSLQSLKDRVRELQSQLSAAKKFKYLEDSDRFASLPSDQLLKQIAKLRQERDDALRELKELRAQLERLKNEPKPTPPPQPVPEIRSKKSASSTLASSSRKQKNSLKQENELSGNTAPTSTSVVPANSTSPQNGTSGSVPYANGGSFEESDEVQKLRELGLPPQPTSEQIKSRLESLFSSVISSEPLIETARTLLRNDQFSKLLSPTDTTAPLTARSNASTTAIQLTERAPAVTAKTGTLNINERQELDYLRQQLINAAIQARQQMQDAEELREGYKVTVHQVGLLRDKMLRIEAQRDKLAKEVVMLNEQSISLNEERLALKEQIRMLVSHQKTTIEAHQKEIQATEDLIEGVTRSAQRAVALIETANFSTLPKNIQDIIATTKMEAEEIKQYQLQQQQLQQQPQQQQQPPPAQQPPQPADHFQNLKGGRTLRK
eukprot:c7118_g1_i1.p1 GENE.c7118_g1_i1~~c7118_g1_i1.p1  ORF type:complete len:522 (-),score=178.30 c7118_g1_i1:13-1578(-)